MIGNNFNVQVFQETNCIRYCITVSDTGKLYNKYLIYCTALAVS